MIYTVTLNPSIDYIVHVDQISLGEVNRMKSDIKLPGGKGLNVSRILNRLNFSTTVLGFFGGFTGAFIEDWLTSEKVNSNLTKIVDDTRINIKLKSTEETEINGAGPSISPSEIASFKTKLESITKDDWVILSGSMPPTLPKDFYDELIKIIKAKDGKFAIDTTGKALQEALAFQPFVIKPNNHELEELFDVTFSSIEDIYPYGKKLRDSGAENVLVSLAGDGALLFTESGIYRSSAPKGIVKNSVGAGDSMIAGFVGAYSEFNDVLKAFQYGLACGSATAFSDDLATKDAIMELLPKITIEKVGE